MSLSTAWTPRGIIEMRELILKLNREYQITVLLSSHILDELARLATHYGFLDQGTLVREVSAQELEAACRQVCPADSHRCQDPLPGAGWPGAGVPSGRRGGGRRL